ncbi:maleylpyruvate isomerase family mycothiol-dependent enzyme [Kineococcus sp. SYSU DK001]|uniref:maleylpyruvate isomerase family mycothiol-dependent enzyme n=1 Tax=Kineococcus sp. SYSU DK001 TaxID=3383122 RepID=UPI003D7D7FA0
MDVFEEIADERRALAAQLAGLTPQQRTARSLCRAWTVHDVLAHLVVPLEVSAPRFVLAVLAAGGRFDRANERVTRRLARRPFDELVQVLARGAGSRFTPPGAGPEAPLVDVLVHGLDIRRPLGLHRDVPAPRLREALGFLVTAPAGLVPRGALTGLRLEADDVGFAHGSGPVVRGTAQELLLATTGRGAVLDSLSGDGVPVLRHRIAPG